MSDTDEPEHDSDGLPQFEVEAIMRARQLNSGKIQYYVKWKRFSSKYNTWENEENLHCQDLINKFLKGEEEEEYEYYSSDEASTSENNKKRGPKTKETRLFIPKAITPPSKKIGPKIFYQNERDKNKPQPKITDAYKNNERIYFILTMADGSLKELTSTVAKSKYPLLVIDYLESNIYLDKQ